MPRSYSTFHKACYVLAAKCSLSGGDGKRVIDVLALMYPERHSPTMGATFSMGALLIARIMRTSERRVTV
jgi:hypothetical protein